MIQSADNVMTPGGAIGIVMTPPKDLVPAEVRFPNGETNYYHEVQLIKV